MNATPTRSIATHIAGWLGIAVISTAPVGIGISGGLVSACDPADKSIVSAQAAFEREDYTEAVRICDVVLRSWPDDSDALLIRGTSFRHLERFAEAANDLDRLLKLNPKNRPALLARGELRRSTNRAQDALADYSAVLAIDERDIVALLGRASCRLNLGQYETALADAKAAITLDPRRAESHGMAASIRRASGDFAAAIRDYSEQLRLSKGEGDALMGRAECHHELGDYASAINDLDQCIKLRPSDALGYWRRAYVKFTDKRNDAAIADTNRAIALDKSGIESYAIRASIYARTGDFERAAADLLQAIRNKPDDAGVTYGKLAKHPVTAEDIRHGELQIAAMLRDRPEMARHITKGDALWQWTIRQFAGEYLGQRIRWEGEPPVDNFNGSCSIAVGGRLAAIRVSDTDRKDATTPRRTFEELWSVAVFELHNVKASTQSWPQMQESVVDGKMDREQFIEATLRSEFGPVQESRAFYATAFLPWMRKSGLTTSEATLWYSLFWPTPDADSAIKYADLSPKHRESYGAAFDNIVVVGLAKQSRYYDALVHADKALKVMRNPEDRAEMFDTVSLCHWHLQDLEKASEAIGQAIRLSPTESRFYVRRAAIFEAMKKFEEALGAADAAIARDAANAEAYAQRASIRAKMADYDRAIEDYSVAVKLDPKDASVRYSRGRILADTGEFAKAVDDFDVALKLDDSMKDAIYMRAMCRNELGDNEKAFADVQNLLVIDQDYAIAYHLAGAICSDLGKFKEALENYDRYIAREPKDASGFGRRAFLRLSATDKDVKNPKMAIVDAKKACELSDWKDSEMLATLAAAYAENGDFRNAVVEQERAINYGAEEELENLRGVLELYKSGKSSISGSSED